MTPRRWRFRKNSGDFAGALGPPKSLQAGGTLDEGAIYIDRPADQEIVRRLREGEFCHVLAPRQVGKSSLRDRAARKLEAEGVLCAQLDLSGTGGDLDEDVEDIERQQDDWLYSRARQILDELAPKVPGGALSSLDMDAAWDAHAAMEPHLRFRLFLHDSVLAPAAAAGKRVVIFIDEIDVLLSYRWRDNFFSTIRAIYNERARAPVYRAVTFCLVGLAHPNELMRKPEHTPFNNSHAVELTDFVEDDQGPFVRALRVAGLRDASDLVAEVFAWTRGHPYMTQKLCKALVESQASFEDAETRVAALARAIFLTRGREVEAVIQYAERYLLADKLTARSMDMLMEYGRIVDGDTVPIADTGLTAAQLHLRFSGIVADVLEEGCRVLVQRNRVFAEAFDMPWLKGHLKDAEIAVRALDFEKASADEKPNLVLMDEELEKLVFGLTKPAVEPPTVTDGTPASKKSVNRADPALSPAVVKLLTASLEVARQKAKEAQAEADKREKEARAAAKAEMERAEEAYRRRRITAISAVVFLVLSVVFGALWTYARQERKHAVDAERDAQEQRDAANRRSLADKATAASRDGREIDALVWALKSAVFKDGDSEAIPTFALESLADAVTAARHSYPLDSTPQSEYSLLSGDGRRGLTWGSEYAILWDLAARRSLAKLLVPRPLTAPLWLSPTGDGAIAVDRSGAVLTWAIARALEGTRRDLQLFMSPERSFSPLPRATQMRVAIYSTDVSRIALYTPSERPDVGQWTVFDTASGTSLFITPTPALQAAAFYGGGDRFAYMDASSTVHVHALDDGVAVTVRDPTLPSDEPAQDPKRPSPPDPKRPSEPALVTLSPDGALLVAARGPRARIWDADTATKVRTVNTIGPVARVRFYRDTLFTMTETGLLQSWTRDGQRSSLLTRTDRVTDVVFFEPRARGIFINDGVARVGPIEPGDLREQPLTGGRRVISAGFTEGGQPITAEVSGALRVWDLPVERLVGHSDTVRSISASLHGDLLVTTSYDHTARTWTLAGAPVRSFPEQPTSELPVPTAAVISPSGDDLVVGYQDGSVRFWDAQSGELLAERLHETPVADPREGRPELRATVESMDISPDGSLVATAGKDGSISILTTGGDALRRYVPSRLESLNIFYSKVRFSPDGRRALASSRLAASVWNLDRDGPMIPLHGHTEDIVHAAFSPDATAVMTVTSDNRIRTFDLKACEGKPACEPEDARVGGASRAHDAAFSPDGRFIAVSLDSGALEIWDLTRKAEPLVVRAPGMGGAGRQSLQMRFSPDSRRLASITEAGTRLFWLRVDTQSDTLVAAPSILYPSDGANPSQLIFTPDGQRLATSHWDEAGSVRLDPTGEKGLVRLACDLLEGQFETHVSNADPGVSPLTDDAVARATPADWARAKTICSTWPSALSD